MVTQKIQGSPLGSDASTYQQVPPDWFLLGLSFRSKWPKTIRIHRLVSFPLSTTTVLLPLESLPAISSLGGGLSVPLRTVTLHDLGEINVSNSQQRQWRRG